MTEKNQFRRRIIWYSYLLLLIVISIGGLEFALRILYGFGNPILYDTNPFYGYRPIPNQVTSRFGGKTVRINNLGLRSDENWDAGTAGKILFLGNSVTYGGSYIVNSELFSTLATSNSPKKSASGGVNAWGVQNIRGLLLEKHFLPADHYVFVLIEADFFRGLSQTSAHQWKKKPTCAIHEVLIHFLHKFTQQSVGYGNIEKEDWKRLGAEAAISLADIQTELTRQGKTCRIFISPTAKQVYEGQQANQFLKNELTTRGIHPIYILDDLRNRKPLPANLFYDHAHLDVNGHKLWSEIIRGHLTEIL